jgi:PKHD-type hydroxylase
MKVIRPFNSQYQELDINDNYASCVWIKNFLNSDEITRTRNLWDDSKVLEGKVSNDGTSVVDYAKRKSRTVHIDGDDNNWLYDKIGMLAMMVNANRYKFEIQGFQYKLQLSKYENTEFIDWHSDFGVGESSIRKLSISIQLSDPSEYEGGDFQLIGDISVPKEKGTAIIFPSFVTHRVAPVTSGCRMSIVGWIAGPCYR